MSIDYNKLREILERKANKAINHLDELKCFVPEFRDVLDSVLYISETLKDLMFLDTECPDCKKENELEKPKIEKNKPKVNKNNDPQKMVEDLLGKPYEAYQNQKLDPNRVVMFYSDTCAPCQRLKPIMEEVTKDLRLDLELVLVDELSGEKHALSYNIMGWPTVLYLRDNHIASISTGADLNKTDEELYNQKYVEIKGVYVYEDRK